MENEKRIMSELLKEYSNGKDNKKIDEYDAEEIIKIGQHGDKVFSSTEILECFEGMDIDNLINSVQNDDKDAIVENVKKIDLEAVGYLLKQARKMKLAEVIYKMRIGNLNVEDEEFSESLELLNLKQDTPIKK